MIILKLNNINKAYGKNKELKILKNFSLEIEKGKIYGIMGVSGSGKSTLLNIMGCLDVPDTGEYLINNKPVDYSNIKKLGALRNSKFSFVFQNFALIKEYTVIENIIFPLRFRKMSKSDKLEIAEKYMEELGISSLKNKSVKDLSGGEQQRVAIVRALCQESDIIFADEPTGSLDEFNTLEIMRVFLDLKNKFNKTIIIVTHDNLISSYCDEIIILKK